MSLRSTVAPVKEPVTLAEAKVHCRPIGTSQDAYIEELIVAARESLEIQTQRSFIEQTFKATRDAFPCGRIIRLERPRLIEVESVTYMTPAGDVATFSEDNYVVDTESEPGRIILKDGLSWPLTWRNGNAVTITYTAGYGTEPEDVPAPLRRAIQEHVAHLYANREPVAQGPFSEIPKTFKYLWEPYQVTFNGT